MTHTPLPLRPWLALLEAKFGSIDNFDGLLTLRYQEKVGLTQIAVMEKQMKALLPHPDQVLAYLEENAQERLFLLEITRRLTRRIEELAPVMVPENTSLAA